MVGEGTCCVYQLEAGGTLRALPTALGKREQPGYTAHAWLVDNDAPAGSLAVGSRRGEVLIVADGEVKQALALGGGASAEAIVAHSKGFVVGTSRGTLVAYERDSESKPYRLGHTFAIGGHGSSDTGGGDSMAAAGAAPAPEASDSLAVATSASAAALPGGSTPAPASPSPCRACSLAVCPADEGVACLTSDCQLVQLAASAGGRKGVFSGVQPLAPAFHAGEIRGLATCVRRAVVATAGADRTIRLWNWADKSCELVGG